MNLYNEFAARLLEAVDALLPGLDASAVTVEPPRDASHGDVATNAALVLAKAAGRSPRSLAETLRPALAEWADVLSVDIAGPGFLNLRFTDDFWRRQLARILRDPDDYGRSNLHRGQRVNVEYVSANPTGPMHVGHCRGAVFGDALANLLESVGYEVCREYYMNDAGKQIEVLCESVYRRYLQACGEDAPIGEGLYPGDYLVPVGQLLYRQFGRDLMARTPEERNDILRDAAVSSMMSLIRDDLERLGIRHELFFSERSLHDGGQIEAAYDALNARGLIYIGELPPPKGKPIEDWEPRPLPLFRATQFGDDIDRPMKKSDGGWTYFAADVAYHRDKYLRGYADQIDVWGADHAGYIKRTQAALAAISNGEARLDIKICQLVRLMRGGEPVKMSKRAGEFVTLREVVEEVGRDAARFIMLFRKNDNVLDFDFAKVTEQSRDNPVFYVQYAHARICSVLRQAAEFLPAGALSDKNLREADHSSLADPGELGLIKLMAQYPRIVEAAAASHEPHRIAFFLHDMASAFHGLWNRGKEEPALRFLQEADLRATMSRLALIRAVQTVIANGLRIVGVTPVEEMR